MFARYRAENYNNYALIVLAFVKSVRLIPSSREKLSALTSINIHKSLPYSFPVVRARVGIGKEIAINFKVTIKLCLLVSNGTKPIKSRKSKNVFIEVFAFCANFISTRSKTSRVFANNSMLGVSCTPQSHDEARSKMNLLTFRLISSSQTSMREESPEKTTIFIFCNLG